MAGEKILFVDDEVLISKLVATYFKRLGYAVTTATDGLEALRMIALEQPDLLITDVRMPNMNGLELTGRLRSSQQTAKMAIIMLSSHAEIDDTLAGYGQGADEYVPKPVELAVLGAKVEALLRRMHRAQAVPGPAVAWPTLERPTVLVVENDPAARQLECSLLRHAGYTVVEAQQWNQAVALATECQPSLVVLDVSTASMSGLQVLHSMATDYRTRSFPILVVSAHIPLLAEEHRSLMAGTLNKPFDPNEFLSVVDTLVKAA